YNLGNAYYRKNQLAPAILNYEKALLRDPGNENINHNLELARTQITDKVENIPDFFLNQWINRMINLFSSDLWAMISMVSFLAFLVFFSAYLYSQRMGLKKNRILDWFSGTGTFRSLLCFCLPAEERGDKQ
ncbi:MAG: tetratricopeptide repeat protein, partial [Bacteroidota bacterium]